MWGENFSKEPSYDADITAELRLIPHDDGEDCIQDRKGQV